MVSGGTTESSSSSSTAADWTDIVHNPTLNVVTNFKSPLRRGLLLRLEPLRIVESCVYGVFEYLLITVVAAWSGAGSGPRLNHPPTHTAHYCCIGCWASDLWWSAKLSYLFFLIWNVPLYLVTVVDALSILWLFQAVATALRVGRMVDQPRRHLRTVAVNQQPATVKVTGPRTKEASLITLVVIGTRFCTAASQCGILFSLLRICSWTFWRDEGGSFERLRKCGLWFGFCLLLAIRNAEK